MGVDGGESCGFLVKLLDENLLLRVAGDDSFVFQLHEIRDFRHVRNHGVDAVL